MKLLKLLAFVLISMQGLSQDSKPDSIVESGEIWKVGFNKKTKDYSVYKQYSHGKIFLIEVKRGEYFEVTEKFIRENGNNPLCTALFKTYYAANKFLLHYNECIKQKSDWSEAAEPTPQ